MFDRLTVVELASVLAGPAVGMFFAELGATVIKVENPAGGDVTRHWRLASEDDADDRSAYFTAVNWGKRSVAIDAATPEGYRRIRKLIAHADIVICSFRHGAAQRLGLDYDTLSTDHPALIYGEISAYGPDDPRPGYDAILQAASGFTWMNGPPDGPPTKMPVALIDVLAAHQLKEGLLVALLRRQAGAGGSHVQVSLLDAGIAALANQATNWLVAGQAPRRMGSDHPNIVPYGTVLQTRDGEVVLAVGNDRQFRELCAVAGCPGLGDDPRFATNAARVCHREALLKHLAAALADMPRADFLARCLERGIPAGPILDMPGVFAQPAARELLLDGGAGSPLRGVRSAVFRDGSGRERNDLSPPPQLNADEKWVRETFGTTKPQRSEGHQNRRPTE